MRHAFWARIGRNRRTVQIVIHPPRISGENHGENCLDLPSTCHAQWRMDDATEAPAEELPSLLMHVLTIEASICKCATPIAAASLEGGSHAIVMHVMMSPGPWILAECEFQLFTAWISFDLKRVRRRNHSPLRKHFNTAASLLLPPYCACRPSGFATVTTCRS